MPRSSNSGMHPPGLAGAAPDSTQSGTKWDSMILYVNTVLGLGVCASYTCTDPAHHPGSVNSGMSDMKTATLAPVHTGALAVVLCVVLVSACAPPGVRLADADRASLASQPAIQLLHYDTP